ncbi:MAG TPA: hypothetical protein VHA37_09145, partial [Candidatus Saccharimonadales bacterium]|nr:hypothetical protein [Candidatus Saccharimonadales bacterium]
MVQSVLQAFSGDTLKRIAPIWLAVAVFATPVWAQQSTPGVRQSQPDLRISSRAVLVDVIVTDAHGNPVKGLGQDAFSVSEQGKPQTISFFEEHHAGQPASQQPASMPALP